jgi:hypothetical protein
MTPVPSTIDRLRRPGPVDLRYWARSCSKPANHRQSEQRRGQALVRAGARHWSAPHRSVQRGLSWGARPPAPGTPAASSNGVKVFARPHAAGPFSDIASIALLQGRRRAGGAVYYIWIRAMRSVRARLPAMITHTAACSGFAMASHARPPWRDTGLRGRARRTEASAGPHSLPLAPPPSHR